eukprot:CFRG5241T1
MKKCLLTPNRLVVLIPCITATIAGAQSLLASLVHIRPCSQPSFFSLQRTRILLILTHWRALNLGEKKLGLSEHVC